MSHKLEMLSAPGRLSTMRLNKTVVISLLVTITLFLSYRSRARFIPKPPEPPPIPTYEIWGIGGLDAQIKVSTVHIESKPERYSPPIKQKVDFQFTFTDVDITQPLPNLPAGEAVIQVPSEPKADGSEIIFAMGTKLDRLRDALPAFTQWASETKTRIVALVEPENPNIPTKNDISTMYKQKGIDITLIDTDLDWWSQFTSLPGVIYDHANENTKWGCIMDDDTHFFSMKSIKEMLSRYNPKYPYYIGGLSENKESWDRIGYFAYGGAGVFLSMPLLKELRPVVDRCTALPDPAGDIRLGTCIMNYTTTKLTPEHRLFQMDLHGDVSGFYEAPRPRPVSTHHWKSWHHHDMGTVGAVSRVCGNECVLQKYITQDGWYITNGFSVSKFSYTREEEESFHPEAMEHTWKHTIWDIPTSWKYTLYPLKPKDEGKIQYIIEKVEEDDKEMTLFYVKREEGRGKGIIRMAWKK